MSSDVLGYPIKTIIPWNKGRGEYLSPEARSRVTAVNIGRIPSREARHKMSVAHMGEKNSAKRLDVRKKISESTRGKLRTEADKERISIGTKKAMALLPLEVKEKIRQCCFQKGHNNDKWQKIVAQKNKGKQAGEKHWNWQGGVSYEPYCPKFNNELKEHIRDRDNRTCQLCGTKENGRKLTVHHIHYDKPNCEPDLIALCVGCNTKVNFDKPYYENYFMRQLQKRHL